MSTDTIRVYSYHLESNRHDGKMPKVIRQDSPEKKSMSIMVGIVKYYNGFSMKRFSQAQLITEHTSDCKYPIILCGDLNDTPQSYLYNYMRSYYKDAFLDKGKGSGKTIESRVPLLRIDYIFGNDEVNFKEYNSIHSTYSDHYMIKARIELIE